LTDRAANVALSPKDCPADILDNIGLLHVSGYAFFEPGPRETVQYLGDLARRHNIPVSVDPASTGFLREVGAKQFLDWTEGAAICFPNLEEAALLSGASDPLEQVTILGAHYGIVVVKCGAAGAVAGNENGIIARVPAPKIEAIDSTGAGDAFFAGFIAALIEGAPLEHCLLRGNQQGGGAASRVGGRPE
jgi:sugar/nucleoside kinase (ribokinase family)